jgi:uncharacterized repeat protein (TIGR01451 family)
VLVVDRLPTGVTYGGLVSASMPVDESGPSGGEVTWQIDTLVPDASGAIVLTVTVDPDLPPGTITNQVEISSDEDEANNTDNQHTLDTPVTVAADLSVAQSASAPVVAGANVTYTIAYANDGPSDAQNVVITDVLPSGTTLVDASPATSGGPTLTWTLGTLGAGSGGTIEVVVTIESAATADLSNAVTVAASTPDPDASDNNRVLVTPVTTEADLWLQKTDAPDPATAGGALTYTLSCGNDGPSTALGVVVTDTLPTGATMVRASPGVAPNGQTLTWALGALAVGASDQITIEVTVGNAVTGSLTNEATIGSSTGDDNLGNNAASAPTTIESHVNLALSQAGPSTVHAGEVLTYTLVYTNAGGPSTAHNVVVTDLLASGATFGAMVSGIPPSPNGALLSWDLGSLDPGALGSLVFTVILDSGVADGTVLTGQAGISSDGIELDSTDNHASVDTAVATDANLSVAQSASAPVVAGEHVTYTITYANAGPSDAQNVVITDVLPSGATLFSAPSGASQAGQTLTWALGTLAAGASDQATVVVTLYSTATGSMTNTVAIGAETGDGDLGDNSAQAVTTIESRVNLSLTQLAPLEVNPGGVLTYTLTYTNVTGPSTAHNVVVTDLLAADVTFEGMVRGASPSENGSLLTWGLGSLDPGASGALQFTVTVGSGVADGTVLTNQAGISSDGIELDDSDNATGAATTVTTATLVLDTDATWMALASAGECVDPPQSSLPRAYRVLGTVGTVVYSAAWRRRDRVIL